MSGNCATGIAEMAMQPGQRDDDRDDEGEPRPVDEDRGDHALEPPACRGNAASLSTTWPGRTFCMPSTMTRSPSFSPSSMTTSVSSLRAGLDAALLDLVLAVDDQDVGAGLVDLQAACGTTSRGCSCALADLDGDEFAIDQLPLGIGHGGRAS